MLHTIVNIIADLLYIAAIIFIIVGSKGMKSYRWAVIFPIFILLLELATSALWFALHIAAASNCDIDTAISLIQYGETVNFAKEFVIFSSLVCLLIILIKSRKGTKK